MKEYFLKREGYKGMSRSEQVTGDASRRALSSQRKHTLARRPLREVMPFTRACNHLDPIFYAQLA